MSLSITVLLLCTLHLQEAVGASPHGAHDLGYQVLRATIGQIFPDAVAVPSLMLAATDTKHYLRLTRNIYRFAPTHIHVRDAKRFHGIDERISLENYRQTINFYYHLIKNADRLRMPDLPRHQHDSL
jgi:carboxypeptidase PM20D1